MSRGTVAVEVAATVTALASLVALLARAIGGAA